MKFLILLLLSSCAKFSYIVEQGVGQVSLEVAGKSNEKVLNDKNVSKKHKAKIKEIIKAKKFFYNFFDYRPTSIYEQTTFLDQEAVTYLVIHSPLDKIEAQTTSFPIVGEFPYLGFFNKSSAQKYKEKLKREGFATYMRPVYAYSTLNHPLIPFDDNILSSFFHFNKEDLVNLIFHELTHTVIFVKNEIEFNENLANFIADELSNQYFKKDLKVDKKKNLFKHNQLRSEIRSLIKILEAKYKKTNDHAKTLATFLAQDFKPRLNKLCSELEMKTCEITKGEWNNARFAAFKTYENKRNELESLYKKSDMNLKEFLSMIVKTYDSGNYKTPFIKNFR